ncbi:GNAT family N-acetyltransferase [Erwinia sorbitola]|uniref:GNAT family N-acetyltransferase n=1 Tax=Erwinia sorbitola TaxID=2681984 RepID=A0A6I6ENB8_9GAMM|nr:GNAT family N-acetyltransferase [Erwinia sorbitola]MTD28434.1 GNAT family N-acetyltransferase [Erwinia sorbitola]QGU86549.1 GNAT family N-acetyltransferase [Erwinia sorbitola]
MKIVIRPFENNDAAAFALAVNESLDSLIPWMAWAHRDYTPEEAIQWFSYTHLQRRQGVANEYGLFSEDGRLLGGAGLRYSCGSDTPAALGYWVRSSEQRKGIARQAVRMIITEAFQQPDIDVIEILAAENNFASRAVATSVGAELIAVRFGLIVLESGPINTAIYHLHRPRQSLR